MDCVNNATRGIFMSPHVPCMIFHAIPMLDPWTQLARMSQVVLPVPCRSFQAKFTCWSENLGDNALTVNRIDFVWYSLSFAVPEAPREQGSDKVPSRWGWVIIVSKSHFPSCALYLLLDQSWVSDRAQIKCRRIARKNKQFFSTACLLTFLN